jgi:hypothetical protein
LTVVPPPAETPAAKETREKASRWEKPAEPQRPSAAVISRFAPPRVAAQNAQPVPPVAPPAPEKLDDLPFGDGPPFGTPHLAEEEEFPLDGFDLPPIGDEEQGQVYPDEELAHIGRRRFPRGVAILGGVLAVVIVGGAAAMYLRSSGNGATTPPVILADTSPTKITPPPSQTPANDPQNKLIYDRVDSKTPAKPADTKLVTPGSEPIASVPSSTPADKPISRVILPGAPGPDGKPAQAAADQPSLADSEIGADGKPIGPRKVRTVVVKPDGTIVSSEAAPVDAQAGAQASVNPAVAPALPPSTTDDTAAISGQQNGKELANTPVPGTPTSLPPEQKQPVQAPAAKQPVTVVRNDPPPTPKPAQPPPQQQQQKVVDSSAPIDLTPGRPAAGRPAPQQQQAALQPQQAQQPAAPPAGGGMLVQISSQRSEDAARATYRDLQARYPNVLGNYQPNIQRADLGERGVYYRVRVGPFAGSDAQRVCDALKAAGGDCVLAAR